MIAIFAADESTSTSPGTLGELLERVLDQARSFPLDRSETLDRDADRHALLPQLRLVLEQAMELLRLVETTATDSPEGPPAWLAGGLVKEPNASERLRRLADLAALARSSLEPFAQCLDEGRFQPLESCLLIWVARANAAILSGLEALFDEWRDLTGAGPRPPAANRATLLRVRHAVTSLRRGMLDAERTYPGDLDMQLRSAGTGLARLIGREEIESGRPADCCRARELQERVLEWVQHPRVDLAAGSMLAAEVRSFVLGLAEINQEPDLVAHDVAAIRELARILLHSDPHEPLSCNLVEKLYALFGRDDRLDQLVVVGASRAQVLARLLEIRRSLAAVDERTAPLPVTTLRRGQAAGRTSSPPG